MPRTKVDPFAGDAGAQLIRDTLSDRGFDSVEERMVAYDGDFWMDFVGPMIDRVGDVLYTEQEVEEVYG